MTTAPPIGSVGLYQVGQTCLLVPKIPPRSITAYVAGGPTALCRLHEQDDTTVEALARQMLMLSRDASETRGPKYDQTVAKQAFDDLMQGFAAVLGIKVAKLAKEVSMVFLTCTGDMARLNPGLRRGRFAFEGVKGTEVMIDLSTTPGFGGSLARMLHAQVKP